MYWTQAASSDATLGGGGAFRIFSCSHTHGSALEPVSGASASAIGVVSVKIDGAPGARPSIAVAIASSAVTTGPSCTGAPSDAAIFESCAVTSPIAVTTSSQQSEFPPVAGVMP